MIRRASHAGSWYTRQASRLSKELDAWLANVPSPSDDGSSASVPLPVSPARAIIAPHAGYSYSGQAAAYAYKCIHPNSIDRIFILGPSHHVYLDGCALTKCETYDTPLGNLKIDSEIVAELKETGHFEDMDIDVDENEHSLEMHLPYIHKIMQGKTNGSFTIVPILVGGISTAKESMYGRILAPYLANPRHFFVISSDFCHWGQRFAYTYRHSSVQTPIHASIEALDREGIACIESLDPAKFAAYLKKTRNTICGRHPIGVLMNSVVAAFISSDSNSGTSNNIGSNITNTKGEQAAVVDGTVHDRSNSYNSGAEIKFIYYAQSSKVLAEHDSSVSYASAYCRVHPD
ncbi:hypothetical protein SeMB42_g06417 [Synchytrium endobioticum]|uniref:AmmeMemoRadiSam system protein B n=1 Tax=Synchytrium endobioticum TaxID=286115 RepID=A0A507CM87_9FUNG|nr:hypothetical protein SeMB42_g06417 [Synchytrium endobioticum]TPX39583.1 hypothetical protein SeLEV6574_g07112 [Synchytrium endobioticum]